MARFDFDMPQDLLEQMEHLRRIDEIAPRLLEAAVPALERHMKRTVGQYNRTGALQRSIKKTKVKKTRNGSHFVRVHPTGKDRKTGVRNIEKLIYMEYGTSKQAARPVLKKAARDAEPEILEAMKKAFEQEVGQ